MHQFVVDASQKESEDDLQQSSGNALRKESEDTLDSEALRLRDMMMQFSVDATCDEDDFGGANYRFENGDGQSSSAASTTDLGLSGEVTPIWFTGSPASPLTPASP